MPGFLKAYVRWVDRANRAIGHVAMLLIFVMVGILLYSSVMKTVDIPPLWTLEMAQFTLMAYFLLGGPYAMQMGAHVRMDLLYSTWSDRRKAQVDCFTVLFLLIYLGFLLYGGFSSTMYALEYDERSFSAWRPYMAPIKIIMTFGVFLMLLQTLSELIKDVAKLRGESLS